MVTSISKKYIAVIFRVEDDGRMFLPDYTMSQPRRWIFSAVETPILYEGKFR
jgi:hypothetical protein